MPGKFDGNTGVTGGKERYVPDLSFLLSPEEKYAWKSQLYDTDIPVSLGSLPNNVRDVRDVSVVAVDHNQLENRAENTIAVNDNQSVNQTKNVITADNHNYGNGPENVLRAAGAVNENRSPNQLENSQGVAVVNNRAQNQLKPSQRVAANGNQLGNQSQSTQRIGTAAGNHPAPHYRVRGNPNGNIHQPSQHNNNNRVSKSQSIRFKSAPHAKTSNTTAVEFSIEEVETTDIDWQRRANKLEEEYTALMTKFQNLMGELQKLRAEKAQIVPELEKMNACYQKLQHTHAKDYYRTFNEILELRQKLRISEQRCSILDERYNNILNGFQGY